MNKELDAPDVLYRGFDVLEHVHAFVNEGVSAGKVERTIPFDESDRML
jgi:hypothetical protein